jgi:hypothetical protein
VRNHPHRPPLVDVAADADAKVPADDDGVAAPAAAEPEDPDFVAYANVTLSMRAMDLSVPIQRLTTFADAKLAIPANAPDTEPARRWCIVRGLPQNDPTFYLVAIYADQMPNPSTALTSSALIPGGMHTVYVRR